MATTKKKKTTKNVASKPVANKKKKPKKQKMEFSKIAFLCIALLFGGVIVGSFALMWHTGTTEALPHLITSTAGLMTTAVGFYYWKSRAENLIRMSKEHGVSIKELKGISGDTDTCYTDSDEV